MSLAAELRRALAPIDHQAKWYLGFSAGQDSLVLLDLLHDYCQEMQQDLHIVHVQESSSNAAIGQAEFCSNTCLNYQRPCQIEYGQANPDDKLSPEESLRQARLKIWQKLLKPSDVLLLGHHQNDQAETILLRLLSGSGAYGLQGMRMNSGFEHFNICRPLLNCPKSALQSYAKAEGLISFNELGNQNQDYLRNYLRLSVLPKITEKWPKVINSLAKTAEIYQQEQAWMNSLAATHVKAAWVSKHCLSIPYLLALHPAALQASLRLYLRQNLNYLIGFKRLQALIGNLMQAQADKSPIIVLGLWQCQRYQDKLYFNLSSKSKLSNKVWAFAEPIEWGPWLVQAEWRLGQGLKLDPSMTELTISTRQGGERCQPLGRQHSQTLKKLLQVHKCPPWLRAELPLFYSGELLMQVGDLWLNQPYQVETQALGLVITLQARSA